jgi:hypothetical protein
LVAGGVLSPDASGSTGQVLSVELPSAARRLARTTALRAMTAV